MKILRTLFLLLPFSAIGREELINELNVPSYSEISHIENAAGPFFSNYNTDDLYFEMQLPELLHFVKNGKPTPITTGNGTLHEIAPFTPNRSLSDHEKQVYESWRSFQTWHGVCLGAFTTNDGQIFLWKKLNDRVLLVCQHDRACYLVLPKK